MSSQSVHQSGIIYWYWNNIAEQCQRSLNWAYRKGTGINTFQTCLLCVNDYLFTWHDEVQLMIIEDSCKIIDWELHIGLMRATDHKNKVACDMREGWFQKLEECLRNHFSNKWKLLSCKNYLNLEILWDYHLQTPTKKQSLPPSWLYADFPSNSIVHCQCQLKLIIYLSSLKNGNHNWDSAWISDLIIHEIFCSHAIGLNSSHDWIFLSKTWGISKNLPQLSKLLA